MNTPLVQAIIAKGGKEYTKYWKDGSPMNRLGEPEDLRGIPAISLKLISGAIVFMASDASKFMTGTELVVDGGYTLY
jgi:NAD(P)-dependent dehydrogenase (short-subunit alcohol dehydrogenase family)